MSYRLRSSKRLIRKSRRNLVLTIIIILVLMYATLAWILPTFIDGLGLVRNIVKPPLKKEVVVASATLAPPTFNIPYEATNTAQINIQGFTTAHSKVELFVDDKKVQITEADSDGIFVFKAVDLSQGLNNFYGKTVDDQQKESLQSKTFQIIFDNQKPKLDISEPADNKTIQGDKKVKVSGRTDSGINLFINNIRIILNPDGGFSTDLPINEGENNINIKAVDQAGNKTEISRKVTFKP